MKLNNKGQIITPIITPIFIPHSSEPDKCPHCHKEEDKIEVCKHCGYKYPEEEGVGVGWFIFFTFFIIYLIFTLMIWLLSLDHLPLIEVIKSQWKFITSLRIW